MKQLFLEMIQSMATSHLAALTGKHYTCTFSHKIGNFVGIYILFWVYKFVSV